MIQNITTLATSLPVVSTNTTPFIKNIPRAQPESSSEPGAVKLTISPEAQRALARYQGEPDKPVAKSENEDQATNSTNTGSKSQQESDPSRELSPEAERIIQKLKQNDQKVRTHELQHVAVAGGYVKSGPVYSYTTGPDGKRYAVGGRVSLDITPVPNNPEASIRKAQIIKRAALAPADPSGADRAVAASATRMEMKAREELRTERGKDQIPDTNKRLNQKFKAYVQSNLQLGKTINSLF
ncbi:MAG: hypothetical protein GXY86_07570 [Firmicutes bacterium]|mgnify:CR=1 FL=1|nr:hypothetical protein [Bacillota bacterium]